MLKTIFRSARNQDGSVVAEAALALPLLLLVAMGILQFGFVMNLYITATTAAAVGLQTFSVMRNVPGAYDATVTAATNAAVSSAWKVLASNVTVGIRVNGVTCTSATCDNALIAAGPATTGGAGGTSEVSVTIACTGLTFLPSLPVMCPVSASLKGTIQ